MWDIEGIQVIVLFFIIFDYFAFKNSASNSASAANAATNLSIVQRVKVTPLRWMGCLSCGVHPRKKCLGDWMCEFLSIEYDASEWTLRIMSDS